MWFGAGPSVLSAYHVTQSTQDFKGDREGDQQDFIAYSSDPRVYLYIVLVLLKALSKLVSKPHYYVQTSMVQIW